jgi:hypothetical protein
MRNLILLRFNYVVHSPQSVGPNGITDGIVTYSSLLVRNPKQVSQDANRLPAASESPLTCPLQDAPWLPLNALDGFAWRADGCRLAATPNAVLAQADVAVGGGRGALQPPITNRGVKSERDERRLRLIALGLEIYQKFEPLGVEYEFAWEVGL